MKLIIEKNSAVMLITVFKLQTIITILGLFVLSFFVSGFFYLAYEMQASIVIVASILPSILYLLFIMLDSRIYAQNSYIEFANDSIAIYFKNLLNQAHVAVPLSQINNVAVSQSFLMKLLGVGVLNFFTKSGDVVSAFGYSFNKAQEMASVIGEKHKYKVEEK